jgi:hypothetical protein
MEDEHQALINNNTWSLVPRPPRANVVTKPETIRLILSIAVSNDWHIRHLDIKKCLSQRHA